MKSMIWEKMVRPVFIGYSLVAYASGATNVPDVFQIGNGILSL
jgi:hypothetical protein